MKHSNNIATIFSAPNYCLASDMEILTERGFMSYGELSLAFNSDPMFKVAQYNNEKQCLEYVVAERTIYNPPNGTTSMINIDKI